jgi:ornithine cyclodeaminase/alanine dehydrogenase-like protein (mu-crystallin family)
MLLLTNEEVGKLLTMPECIETLEAMYGDYAKSKALLTQRMDNIAPNSMPDAYYAFKHMGGTWPAAGIQALRINSDVITHPIIAGKVRRVKQPLANGRWVGLVMLFSTETGQLLAMFPDGVMQRMRVGSANGIALRHLAREDVSTLALIGSGWQAGTQLMAALAVRPFKKVRVYSLTRENRERFVAEMQPLFASTEIKAVSSAEECVEGTDVIMAGTSSMMRVIESEWLRPGMHISCIKTQEVDPDVLEQCDVIFIHTKEQAKQLNNIMAGTTNILEEGTHYTWVFDKERGITCYPSLGELVAGMKPGRQNPEQITCFVNNVGMGLQFAAAGALLLKKAHEAGVGQDLDDDLFSEDVHP